MTTSLDTKKVLYYKPLATWDEPKVKEPKKVVALMDEPKKARKEPSAWTDTSGGEKK